MGKRSNSNVAVTRSGQDVCVGGYIISFKLSQSNNTTRTFLKEGNRKYLRIHLRPFGLLVWEAIRADNVPAGKPRPHLVLTEHWFCVKIQTRFQVYSGEQRQSLLPWSLETTPKESAAAIGQAMPLTRRKGARSATDLELVGSSGPEA